MIPQIDPENFKDVRATLLMLAIWLACIALWSWAWGCDSSGSADVYPGHSDYHLACIHGRWEILDKSNHIMPEEEGRSGYIVDLTPILTQKCEPSV